MSEDNQIPDGVKELETAIARIAKAGMPVASDAKDIHELLKSGALCRVLCRILKESDDKLTMVGTGDLSNEKALKDLIKVQGEAIGLSRAVEYIIDYSLMNDNKENDNA